MGSIANDTTTAANEHTTLTVAVIGGGIGGLTLTIGLLNIPHINVHIYEAAPAFGEIGAGITIGPNAQRALELIDPGARAAFDKHRTPNLWSSHKHNYTINLVGKGENAGEVIAPQPNKTGMQCVHRAKFLDELVKCVPAYRAHFNKRLIKIEEKSATEPLVLHFKDGTTATADAVIGADGIHSTVRAHLLGEDHPATKPVYSGAAAYRGLVPMDQAVEKLGAEIAQNSTMLCGPGKGIMSYPIDFGETLNIVLMDYSLTKWEHEKWIVPATYDELSELLKGWGKSARGMIELMDSPKLALWGLFQSPPAPYYSKGRITIMGDAAHASTPFQGQGAAQAIEDSLVLKVLLAKVETPRQIANALAAYDQVRRPRTQRVVSTSRESGDLIGMQAPGIGSDLDKMREAFKTRMAWIWNRDLLAQNATALKLYEESL